MQTGTDKKNWDNTEILEKVDALRKLANSRLDNSSKSTLGQFMTPGITAEFMASLFPKPKDKYIYLLDPGAGIGSLTSAFISQLIKWPYITNIEIDAFEIDQIMISYLRENYEACNKELSNNQKNLSFSIHNKDFIETASEKILQSESLWAQKYRQYSHCIMNPPYKKILSTSRHRTLLRSVGIEAVNLYSGFVALALTLLKDNGFLVAIIPRSFCNGPYYKPFRKYLLKNSAIRHLHLFDSRNKAFKEDKVLQENVIIMLKKKGVQKNVTISTSTDDSFSDLSTNIYPFDQIVLSDDSDFFIHIPSGDASNESLSTDSNYVSLNKIGIQVSTGPIVDFRLKEYLQKNYNENTVPLLYPCHFSSMKTQWPVENGKKPNAIVFNSETKKWLLPKGFYTVVRRFSSKEEKRRIVASVVNPEDFPNNKHIGIENHLNFFHIGKKGMPKHLAFGLAAFLNTKTVDDAFRRFSGHTQVNATDLRGLKYPDKEILILLGKWVLAQDKITAEMIDTHLEILRNAR